MKIALISSNQHKHYIVPYGHISMILAHKLDDAGVVQYYHGLDMRKIMDNGAHEGKVPSNLIERAKSVLADELIAPDVMLDGPATVTATRDFLDVHSYRELELIDVMGVPQGKTADEYLSCFFAMVGDPRIRTIGVGYIQSAKAFGTRRNCLNHIGGRCIDNNKVVHLLGLPDVREIYQIRNVMCPIRSVDTMSPYIDGLKGVRYDFDGKPDKSNSIKERIDEESEKADELYSHYHTDVLHNIAVTLKLAETPLQHKNHIEKCMQIPIETDWRN